MLEDQGPRTRNMWIMVGMSVLTFIICVIWIATEPPGPATIAARFQESLRLLGALWT